MTVHPCGTQRSISCFVRDKASDFNIQLPASWSPFGWLVMLCSVLRKDVRMDGVMRVGGGVSREMKYHPAEQLEL